MWPDVEVPDIFHRIFSSSTNDPTNSRHKSQIARHDQKAFLKKIDNTTLIGVSVHIICAYIQRFVYIKPCIGYTLDPPVELS